jgi:hypothetical protein
VNKLAEHRIKMIKENIKLQKDPIERIIKETTKRDIVSIANTLANVLSHEGKKKKKMRLLRG